MGDEEEEDDGRWSVLRWTIRVGDEEDDQETEEVRTEESRCGRSLWLLHGLASGRFLLHVFPSWAVNMPFLPVFAVGSDGGVNSKCSTVTIVMPYDELSSFEEHARS